MLYISNSYNKYTYMPWEKKSKTFSFLMFDVGLKMNRSVMRSEWEEKDQNDLWEIKVI